MVTMAVENISAFYSMNTQGSLLCSYMPIMALNPWLNKLSPNPPNFYKICLNTTLL
jgi:hypothetical protein